MTKLPDVPLSLSPSRHSSHDPIRRGTFVVLEGIDGSGTTSQSHEVAKILLARGRPVLRTCEPSPGPIGALARNSLSVQGQSVSPQALALLFAADRIEHIETEIKPWLGHPGSYVICDRYVWSALAYQTLHCSESWVKSINQHAIVPDLTILLSVPVGVAQQRVKARAESDATPSEIFDAFTIQERVAANYENVYFSSTGSDVTKVDGTLPKELVTERIMRLIDNL